MKRVYRRLMFQPRFIDTDRWKQLKVNKLCTANCRYRLVPVIRRYTRFFTDSIGQLTTHAPTYPPTHPPTHIVSVMSINAKLQRVGLCEILTSAARVGVGGASLWCHGTCNVFWSSERREGRTLWTISVAITRTAIKLTIIIVGLLTINNVEVNPR